MITFMAGVVVNDDLARQFPSLRQELWQINVECRGLAPSALHYLGMHATENGCRYAIARCGRH